MRYNVRVSELGESGGGSLGQCLPASVVALVQHSWPASWGRWEFSVPPCHGGRSHGHSHGTREERVVKREVRRMTRSVTEGCEGKTARCPLGLAARGFLMTHGCGGGPKPDFSEMRNQNRL